MSEKILQSRYKQLLSVLSDLDGAVSQLHTQGLITLPEKEEVSRRLNRVDKEAFLCACLTGKGASGLVNISQVLKSEQIRQYADVSSAKVEHPAAEAKKMAEKPSGMVGEDAGPGMSWDTRVSSSNGPVQAPFTTDKLHLVEDTFSVLFFTFLTQLLHYFNSFSQSPSAPMHDKATPKTTPTKSPSWLKLDLMLDSTRDYFSAHALKDVVPSERSPVAIKLSLLLESFQQFYHTHKSFKSKNLSLHEKLLDSIKTRERLEIEVNRLSRSRFQDVPVSNTDFRLLDELRKELEGRKAEMEALRRSYARSEQRCKQLVVVTQQWALECDDKVKLIDLQEEELKELKAEIELLERRVTKYKKFWVESRKEEEQGGGGRATDLQYEELRNELAFRRELYDMVLKERDEAQKEVSTLFAELESVRDHNVQLADRAANYQVQAKAKEPAVREMSSVLEQNRKLKEELDQVAKEKAELQDRVKALEVQIEEYRNTSVDGKKHSLSDKEQLPPPSARVDAHARQQTRMGQVLITGRSSVPAKSHGAPVFSDVSNFQCPPQKKHRHHHNQQLVVSQEPSSKANNPNYPQLMEDDASSLASSDGGGESGNFYSSHSSTTNSGSGLTTATSQGGMSVSSRSRPGSAPPSEPRLLSSQLGSRDASGTNWSGLESGELPLSEVSFAEGTDYTQAIRYPNHSKIHVAPLMDEDRLVFGSESVKPARSPSRGSSSDERFSNHGYRVKSPPGFEQSKRRPDCVNGEPPNVATLLKRTCPTCNLVFRSLSDAEFEGHRRSCRGSSISI